MKKNISGIATFAALAALTLSSGCGTLFKSGADKVQQEAVLPHDRETIAANKDVAQFTPEDIKKGAVKGDWAIETVNGKPAVGETAPFLKFVPAEKRVYGNNGCNTIMGPYTYNAADSTLSFGEMASTMMACGKEGITDYEINLALSKAKYYTWDSKNSDYYLHLLDADRNEVMTLMHQNFDFLNGAWLVRRIDDQPIDNPDMKLVIDVDEGKLHGNTGCNLLNGKFETDMEAPNSISFSAIGMTRMACPDPSQETLLVVALEEVSAAKPVSPDEVLLFNSQGKQVLSLTRTVDDGE